jgi:hypothetical protein
MPSLFPDDINDPVAEQYRARLEELGEDLALVSNHELIKRLGDSYIQSGGTNDDIARAHGSDFLNKYLDEKNKPEEGRGVVDDALASFRRQAIGLGQMGYSGVGLLADTVGLDSVRDAAMKKAAELSADAASGAQPTIDSYADVRWDRPGEIARYAANLVGGALPSTVESLATFGAGGVAGLAAKGVIKKKLKSLIKDATEDQIEKLATKKAFQTGALAGVGTSSGVMGTGEVYSTLYPYTQLDPSHEDYIDPDTARNVSFVGGGIVAGLDFASAGKMLNKLINVGDAKSTSYLKRLLANLPEGVLLEGTTEALQEFVIKSSEKYVRQEFDFSDAEIEEMINAGIMGAVGGGQFSAISAVRGPKKDITEINDEAQDPTLDVGQQPDVDQILGAEEQTQVAEFEVGQEVAQPFGVTGVIQSIKNNEAVVRTSDIDQDGVEVTNDVKVPLNELAPVVAAPVIVKTEKAPDIIEDEVETPDEKEAEVPEAELGTATFKPLEDDYTSELQTQNVTNKSDIDVENAKRIYNTLLSSAQNSEGFKQNQTYGSMANFLGTLDPELKEIALSNNKAALRILKEAGILGDNFNWQRPTKKDLKEKEEVVFRKNQKTAMSRKKYMGDRLFEVRDEEKQVPGILRRRGSGSYFVLREIIDDPKDPERDGKIIVDEYADEDLSEQLNEGIEEDPKLFTKPQPKQKRKPREKTARKKAAPVDEVTDLADVFPDVDMAQTSLAFRLGNSRKGFKKVNFSSKEELESELRSDTRLKNAILKKDGYVHLESGDVVQDLKLEKYGSPQALDGIRIGDLEIDLTPKFSRDDYTDYNNIPDSVVLDRVYFDEKLDQNLRDDFFKSGIGEGEIEFGEKGGGKALAIFRNDDQSSEQAGSFRVVSVKKNDSRITAYDANSGSFQPISSWVDPSKGGTHSIVGFVMQDKVNKKETDIYFDDAEALRKELAYGGYVGETLVDGLPAPVDRTTFESGMEESVNYEPELRKLRQIQREFEKKGLTRDTQIEKPDVISKEAAELLAMRERGDSYKQMLVPARKYDQKNNLRIFDLFLQTFKSEEQGKYKAGSKAMAKAKEAYIVDGPIEAVFEAIDSKVKEDTEKSKGTEVHGFIDEDNQFVKHDELTRLYNEILAKQKKAKHLTKIKQGNKIEEGRKKETFDKTSPYTLYKKMSGVGGQGYAKFNQLLNLVNDIAEFNILLDRSKGTQMGGNIIKSGEQPIDLASVKNMSRAEKKRLTDLSIKLLGTDQLTMNTPTVTLRDALEDFFSDASNPISELHDALGDIITDKSLSIDDLTRLNRQTKYTKIAEIAQDHAIFSGAIPAEVNDKTVDNARKDPFRLAAFIKRLLVNEGMDSQEAGKLLQDVMNTATVGRDTAGKMRSKGKDAKDKEFLDNTDPVQIFKDQTPINKTADLEARNKQIDKAFKKLEKEIPNYANLLQGFFGKAIVPEKLQTTWMARPTEQDARHSMIPMVDGLTDLATGKPIEIREAPVTPELIEADHQRSMATEVDVMAREEHPLEKYPELRQIAKQAIKDFIGSGDPLGTFDANYTLGNIISKVTDKYKNGSALTMWASFMRGHPSLGNVRVRFMPWEEFRKYARVSEGNMTAAVYMPGRNEIAISDTFYNDTKQTVNADETLANLIVHEITHVPVRLGMEVGYAFDAKDTELIKELSKYTKDGELMAKIYRNVRDVIIPALRESNNQFGVNVREYSLSSVEEFFAELSSNYELRHLLKKTRMTPEMSKSLGLKQGVFKTVWQWIRRLIARMVGVQPSLLDQADNYLKVITKTAYPLGKYMGNLPFDSTIRAQQMLFDFDPKVEEAPSDLPTFWQMFRIKKSDPKVYQKVADVLIVTGSEEMDGQIAYDYGNRLGLNVARLRSEMQKAHRRYWAKNRYSQIDMPDRFDNKDKYVPHKMRDYGPSNTEVSLDILQSYRHRLYEDYLEVFDEDTLSSEVYEMLENTDMDPGMKNFLRALGREDFFGFDTPAEVIMAIMEEDGFLMNVEVTPDFKASISRYVNYLTEARYSQVKVPPKPSPKPDEAAMVGHTASVAANNEVVRQLTKVFTSLVQNNNLPDTYKGKDGLKKFINEQSGMSIEKNLRHYSKILGKEINELSKISIDDQGMNRRGRDRAMIDAVGFLSRARNNARIKKADISDQLVHAKAVVAEFERLLAAARSRKLTPPVELAEAMAEKMVNSMNVPRIEKLLESMKLEGMNVDVADVKALREMPDLKSKVKDTMEAIIEMSDIVETLGKKEIVERIKTSTDKRFDWLKKEGSEYAMHVFADRTVYSRDLYTLYRIATLKDLGEKNTFFKDVEAIASAETKEQAETAYKESGSKGRVGSLLKKLSETKIQSIKVKNERGRDLQYEKLHEAIDGLLLAREARLRTALGELEPVDIRQGATMLVMERRKGENGKYVTSGPVRNQWQLGRFTIRYQNGKMVERDKFVRLNASTLEFLKDDKAKNAYQQEPWYDAMKEQANRALYEPVGDQYFTVRKQAWMAGIESLNARLNRMGYEGKKLGGMLARTAALFRDVNSDVQYYAKKWNVAYINLLEKLGMNGKEMFTTFYQDVWWYFDNHPEHDGNETEAVNGLWKHLKENGNVPDKSKLNAETKKALVTLIRRTIDARDFEANYNLNVLGNRIKDDFKVQSLIDGETVDFYRRPVDLGYATIPRVLNEGAIANAISILKAPTPENKEFSGKWVPSKSNEDGIYKRLMQLDGRYDLEVVTNAVKELFSEDVVTRWAGNYLKSDNRRSVFYGPNGEEMGNAYVNAVWRNTTRNQSGTDAFMSFLDTVFQDFATDESTDQDRADWYFSMIKQFQRKYDRFHSAFIDIQTQHDAHKTQNMLMNSPRSLDARNHAATLPKEYFYYDSYDEITSAVRLQMMIASSVFGRGGSNANAVRAKADERWSNDKAVFLGLISEATGAKADGVLSDYSKAVRKRVYDLLQNRPAITKGRTPEATFEDLFANAAAIGEMEIIFDHLNKYYGSGNVAGPFKDANVPLELLGLQSLAVLNNPKSSFWQGLSMTEFPMAYHGLNGMSLKATTKAFTTFIDQTFGGMLEAMGINIGRSHIYAEYLANTHFQNSESDLTWKEYQSQVGSGGELTGFGMDSATAKKGIRFMKKMAMHNRKSKKKGLRSPVDWKTPLVGMFPYINANINHAVGVGAIFSVESEVLKIAKVIENQGLQNFHNFTAEELGLGAGAFEFFVGQKDGFNQMNNLLESVGAPNLSRLAFDFVQRKKNDPNTPVIEANIGKLINQMAMNEVSGEGFNAKPAALYTNDLWKYAGIFLGWPLWKMARDNRVLQGNSNYVFGKDARTDRATWMAFLKYLGLVSAVYTPAGLAFAMLVDWYDDEVLEKPNNLPPITPWALLPVVGPFMAAEADPNFSIYAITSRLAKAGVPYGMGMDVANSVFSKADPYGAAKEFSLDSRIFAWSMIKNVYDAMGNWMHQGEMDYHNVMRPILYGVGGNSAIQFIDATTAMFDIDIAERRVADYIGVRNIIKKYAWGMGLPLKAPSKGGYRPTPFSINLRQMERAAYNYDTKAFQDAYQDALDVLREEGKANPEREIRNAFQRRMVTKNITDGAMTEQTLQELIGLMDEEEAAKVMRYLQAHAQYSSMIEVSIPTKRQTEAMLYYKYGIEPKRMPSVRRDPRLMALDLY